MAIAAIIIVNVVNVFTSFNMYDFLDASIMLHDLPELPIGKDCIKISTSDCNTDE